MDSFVSVFGCLKGGKGGRGRGENRTISNTFSTWISRGNFALNEIELELVELNDR